MAPRETSRQIQSVFPGLWTWDTEIRSTTLADSAIFKSVIKSSLGKLGLGELTVHHESVIKSRGPNSQRSRFAGDHFWHHDLMREYADLGQLVTFIACIEVDASVPTVFLDMVTLHNKLNESGVYDRLGYSIDDLRKLQGIYSRSTYLDTTLSAIDSLSRGESLPETESIRNVSADEEDVSESKAPLVVPTPYGDALFIDHERCSAIVDENNNKHPELLKFLRLYTGNCIPEEVHSKVQHLPGRVLIFNRDTTLHRSIPGNDEPRKIHIGWASQKRLIYV